MQHRPGAAGLIVAHYFKFHALADIEAEVQRLGLVLRFRSDFAPLFQPVQVGTHRVGNAFCIQPMEGSTARSMASQTSLCIAATNDSAPAGRN